METNTETNTETNMEMGIVMKTEMEKDKEKETERGRVERDGNVECHWIRRPHPRDSGDHEEEAIAVLGISDSRTKGSGSKQIGSSFVYTWSGGDTHADHGVVFIVDEQHSQ